MGKSNGCRAYPLFYIEWYDHWSPNEGGWLSLEDYDSSPSTVTTIGWKIKEDRHGVLLASTVEVTAPHFRGMMYILKAAMKKKKRLSPSIKVE